MKATMQSPDFPWVIVGERLRFLGKPSFCRGNVHFRNRSDEKLRIKRIPLAAAKLTGPAEISVSHLQVFARLLPGAEVQACAQIFMPPHTPPGRYTAEALVGADRKPVTVEVLEAWDVAVIPDGFSLKTAGGERLLRTIQLTNRGNMPWEIRRAALAPLQEQHGIHRNIFLALKNGGNGIYENVLNDFAARMKDTEVEPAKVKIISESGVLQPGETREIGLEFSLPTNLKKNRIYTGEVSFENARLLLEIEVRERATVNRKELKS